MSYADPAESVTCKAAGRTPGALATKRSQTLQRSPPTMATPLHSFARIVKSDAFVPLTETPEIVALVVAISVTGTTVLGAATSVVGQRTIPGTATAASTSPGSFSFTSPHSPARPPSQCCSYTIQSFEIAPVESVAMSFNSNRP